MFAWKPWIEIAARLSLSAIIVLNALIPTTAIAMSVTEQTETVASPAEMALAQGMIGSANKYGLLTLRLPTTFQDGTPTDDGTVTPTEMATETPTPEPSLEPVTTTDTPENTPATTQETPTPAPPIDGTPTPGSTPNPTQTLATPATSPKLSLEFLATPSQIKVTDHATFTLKIINSGQYAITGLRFTNILPEGFNFVQGKSKNFNFDPKTRELRWLADQGTSLPAGDSLSLEYTVVVIASKVEVAQIIDTASVSADGLAEPSIIETAFC